MASFNSRANDQARKPTPWLELQTFQPNCCLGDFSEDDSPISWVKLNGGQPARPEGGGTYYSAGRRNAGSKAASSNESPSDSTRTPTACPGSAESASGNSRMEGEEGGRRSLHADLSVHLSVGTAMSSRRRMRSEEAMASRIKREREMAEHRVGDYCEICADATEPCARCLSWAGGSGSDSSETTRQRMLQKRQLHDQGFCRPCAYNSSKANGCRHGWECEFCHFCDKAQHRAWKSRMRKMNRLERQYSSWATNGWAEHEHEHPRHTEVPDWSQWDSE
eukprot:TRINITY_DN51498_c0_g1_i1.p1 TRINITY_DN51498_c0_g1~~TRINITY_DN51498_c0_g1_i1.p1  ORF type:complete len:278 (-),score=24.08 TRINITY_DN51498_c0_g1_i1:486-1319(-)